jgi:hypothetical protein
MQVGAEDPNGLSCRSFVDHASDHIEHLALCIGRVIQPSRLDD